LLEGVLSWGSGACEATTVGSWTGRGVDDLPSTRPPISFSTLVLDTMFDTFSCSADNNNIQTNPLTSLEKYNTVKPG
jgi:hypothetical protein